MLESATLRRFVTRPGKVWMLLILIVLLAGGIGLFSLPRSHGAALERSAPPSKAVASGGAFKPTPEQMATLKLTPVTTLAFVSEVVTDGKIALNADTTTPVFSPYSGRVVQILAGPGDRVRRGTSLLVIESSEFVQAQNDLINAGTALETARAQLAQAGANENRKHGLVDAKAAAMQDWEQSKAEQVVAQSNLSSAKTTQALARNKLRILGQSAREIDAIMAGQKISPMARLIAPISGTVTDRQVGLGQYIQSGASNPVYTIGNLARVWLVGNVRETDAPMMRVGLPVEARVLALPNRVLKATLDFVAPSVDPVTHRLTVRAEIDNPDGLLKPEMFASISIVTGHATSTAAVPESAIIHEGEATHLWVENKDGSLVSRQVRTGQGKAGMAEVLSGLAVGETVVTGGTLFIDRAANNE